MVTNISFKKRVRKIVQESSVHLPGRNKQFDVTEILMGRVQNHLSSLEMEKSDIMTAWLRANVFRWDTTEELRVMLHASILKSPDIWTKKAIWFLALIEELKSRV